MAGKTTTSCSLAVQMAKDLVESVVGTTRPTHRKGKFRSKDITKATAEITTLQKARDLIRTLFLDECNSGEKEENYFHLKILLDRLVRMGVSTIPRSMDIPNLHQWSESYAPLHIQTLKM